MITRKKTILFLMLNFLLVFSIVGFLLQSGQAERLLRKEVAQRLLITDLCLTTESRHTRNLSFPELIAPFQDLPGGLDHFPSSTFLQPPASTFAPIKIEGEQ